LFALALVAVLLAQALSLTISPLSSASLQTFFSPYGLYSWQDFLSLFFSLLHFPWVLGDILER